MSENKLPQIIKYRTYYKAEQYSKNHLEKHDTNTIVINTNDEKYPFSKMFNKYWSEYALLKVIWKAGKKSEYVGLEQFAETIPSTVRTDGLAIYYKKVMKNMGKSVYQQYKAFHISSDMDKVVSILNRKYGNENKYTDYIMNGHKFYYGSIFIMKWEIFDKMCEFLFGILDELDKELGLNFNEKKYEEYFEKNPTRKVTTVQGKENYQRRAFGFLAERLVSAFIIVNYSPEGNSAIMSPKEEEPTSLETTIRSQLEKPRIKLHPTMITLNKINKTPINKRVVKKTKVFLGGGLNW